MKRAEKNLKQFVSSDCKIKNGLPVFKGTRVPVYVILKHLSLGWTIQDLKEAFPSVRSKHISGLINSFSENFKQNYEQKT